MICPICTAEDLGVKHVLDGKSHGHVNKLNNGTDSDEYFVPVTVRLDFRKMALGEFQLRNVVVAYGFGRKARD
jgi:hypothetical protein